MFDVLAADSVGRYAGCEEATFIPFQLPVVVYDDKVFCRSRKLSKISKL